MRTEAPKPQKTWGRRRAELRNWEQQITKHFPM
jgi:hypothetical protein